MDVHEIKMRVRFAWWLPLYLRAVGLRACMTRTEPDYERVERVVARAVRMTMEG
ncbi:hypothetical protein [Burkholderia ubonensis]|uniref:hypothetical protein n=1 Tax=Burkholderia ubonensis TaxID=101571 RepID=UPI000AA4C4B8|nr:hypothetical protein [Burkholderia ubonensis]